MVAPLKRLTKTTSERGTVPFCSEACAKGDSPRRLLPGLIGLDETVGMLAEAGVQTSFVRLTDLATPARPSPRQKLRKPAHEEPDLIRAHPFA